MNKFWSLRALLTLLVALAGNIAFSDDAPKTANTGELKRVVLADVQELDRFTASGVKSSADFLRPLAPTRLPKWRQAAEHGIPQGQFLYGLCLGAGLGIESNATEAASWYRKAAEQDYAAAQYALGKCYADGNGATAGRSEARTHNMSGKRIGGTDHTSDASSSDPASFAPPSDSPADSTLGVEMGRLPEYFAYAKRQAKGGDIAGANQTIANISRWKNDNYADIEALARAPNSPFSELARSLVTGSFVSEHIDPDGTLLDPRRNPFVPANMSGDCNTTNDPRAERAQAVVWYRKAAEQDHGKAQLALADCYFKGDGVPRDPAQAVTWYGKAAEQGNADAQFNLGKSFETGIGVLQNDTQACVHYLIAAALGQKDASASVTRLRDGRLSPAQYASAQQSAQAWMEKARTNPRTPDQQETSVSSSADDDPATPVRKFMEAYAQNQHEMMLKYLLPNQTKYAEVVKYLCQKGEPNPTYHFVEQQRIVSGTVAKIWHNTPRGNSSHITIVVKENGKWGINFELTVAENNQ